MVNECQVFLFVALLYIVHLLITWFIFYLALLSIQRESNIQFITQAFKADICLSRYITTQDDVVLTLSSYCAILLRPSAMVWLASKLMPRYFYCPWVTVVFLGRDAPKSPLKK